MGDDVLARPLVVDAIEHRTAGQRDHRGEEPFPTGVEVH